MKGAYVKLILCFVSLIVLIASGEGKRSKRYLVYPDGGPARAQFILGLGVPVDLKEQSVTVGTVIKFQYDLPTNSTEYTSRIYGFANTVDSRDMQVDKDNNAEVINETERGKVEEIVNDENNLTKRLNVIDDNNSTDVSEDDDENSLIDIEFNNDHKIDRRDIYTEGGVSRESYTLDDGKPNETLEEAIKRQEDLEAQYKLQDPELRKTNRWDLYRVMEQMAEKYGYSGRPCMLRTVCEAAEIPFTHHSGLLGEIVHILFTPSTTRDELTHHSDNEYHAAERLGRDQAADCETLFPECEASPLETFTQVGFDTLHKFGFAI